MHYTKHWLNTCWNKEPRLHIGVIGTSYKLQHLTHCLQGRIYSIKAQLYILPHLTQQQHLHAAIRTISNRTQQTRTHWISPFMVGTQLVARRSRDQIQATSMVCSHQHEPLLHPFGYTIVSRNPKYVLTNEKYWAMRMKDATYPLYWN